MTQDSRSPLSQPRKKIEDYSFCFQDIIGKGYSSHVYKGKNDCTCKQSIYQRVIDMKQLKSQFNRNLLSSEIQILKLLRSYDNILSLKEVYTTRNNTYIITQLCSEDLHSLIRKKGKLSENQATKYIWEVLGAYKHLYELGIVHRDLKPANLLLNQIGTVKIADFGFAIKFQKLKNPCSYNVGSPLYMSPEALGKSQYSVKSDIWALGVIFYQMLTGIPPWQAKYEKDLLKKIELQDISSKLQKLNFSPTTNQFLKLCLKRNVNERVSLCQLMQFKDSLARNMRNSMDSKQFRQSLKYIPLKKSCTQNESINLISNNNNLNEARTTQQCLANKVYNKTDSHLAIHYIKNLKSTKTSPTCNQNNSTNSLKVMEQNQNKVEQMIDVSQEKIDNWSTNCNSKSRNRYVKKFKRRQEQESSQSQETNKAKTTTQFHNPELSSREKTTPRTTIPYNNEPISSHIPVCTSDGKQKLVSKILLCEIHFCRFLYKLTVKIQKSMEVGAIVYFVDQVSALMISYSNIIRSKLENVKSLQKNNFLKMVGYDDFINSESYRNIFKLSQEYLKKYARDMGTFWNLTTQSITNKDQINTQSDYGIGAAVTTQLIKSILAGLVEEIPTKVLFQEKYSNDIIILDYLMTSKQLLSLAGEQNYYKFARKSRIQEIVEGLSSKIFYELYCKIRIKAQTMLAMG